MAGSNYSRHIHLLLRVGEPLPEGKHLGMVIRGFKTGCTRAWWKQQDEVSSGQPKGEGQTSGETLATVMGGERADFFLFV